MFPTWKPRLPVPPHTQIHVTVFMLAASMAPFLSGDARRTPRADCWMDEWDVRDWLLTISYRASQAGVHATASA